MAVNSATVAHYGFTRTELLRMTILDIRPPEDVPRIVKDVLYPRFHDPDGDLRRHRTKKGKLINVGIKAYKLMFNDRDVEVVVVVLVFSLPYRNPTPAPTRIATIRTPIRTTPFMV